MKQQHSFSPWQRGQVVSGDRMVNFCNILVNRINHLLPRQLFLFFGIMEGLILVFLTPAFQVPDEASHFLRAYQVSEFGLMPEVKNNVLGGNMPVSLSNTISLYNGIAVHPNVKMNRKILETGLQMSLNPGERSFYFFANSALYSPVSYLPQAAGIVIGRNLGVSPLVLLYLGRLFNLAAWILLVYLSLAILPFNSWLFLVLALLPMSMFQAASLSADVMTNALSFLLISLVFRIAWDADSRLGRKEILWLTVLAVLLTLSKSVYFFLVFLFLIIPVSKAAGRNKYLIAGSLIAALTVFSLFSAAWVTNHLLSLVNPIENLYLNIPGTPKINPAKQMALISSDIPGFLKLAARSFYLNSGMIGHSFIGVLGWMEISFRAWYYNLSLLFLGFLALSGSGYPIRISLTQRTVMLVTVIVVILVFSVAMYLTWNAVGDPVIFNLQGRYFIPVAPLLLGILYNRKIKVPPLFTTAATIAFVTLSAALTVKILLARYYL